MMQIVKKMLCFVNVLFYKIYPYKLHQLLSGYQDELYSIWIRQLLPGKPFGLIRKGVRIEGAEFVSIGNGVQIGRNTLIEALTNRKGQQGTPSIVIGTNCSFGYENHITAMGKVVIGNGLLTGRHVLISDNNHGNFLRHDLVLQPRERELTTKGGIYIGDNVWIGENATVLGGVRIGNGAVIAANAVVVHDVPEYSLAAGVPARVVKSV